MPRSGALLMAVVSMTIGGSPASGNEPVATRDEAVVDGLTIAVASTRTWRAFDGKTPAAGAGRWVAGDARIEAAFDPSLPRLRAGTREVRAGSNDYTVTIDSFAAGDAPGAAGPFLEVCIRLRNAGPAPVRVRLLDPAARMLDAGLQLKGGRLSRPRAFLIPGLGVEPTSLIVAYKGQLGVSLAPGEETWALIVFDAPDGEALLKVKTGTALPLAAPSGVAAVSDLARWRENCAAVASYESELVFTVQFTEPRFLATQRAPLLGLLNRLKLDDSKNLKARREKAAAAVRAAPSFKPSYGSADMKVPRALDVQLSDLLAAVAAEARNRGAPCEKAPKAGSSLLEDMTGASTAGRPAASPVPSEPVPTVAPAAAPLAASAKAPPKPAGDDSQAEVRKRLQAAYVRYLQGEGFRPEIDADGDVKFTREGFSYFVQVDAKEPAFFRILFPNIWKAAGEAERAKLLRAVEETSRSTKVAKAFMVKDQAWITYEQFLPAEGEIAWTFARAMAVLGSARRTLVDAMEREQEPPAH